MINHRAPQRVWGGGPGVQHAWATWLRGVLSRGRWRRRRPWLASRAATTSRVALCAVCDRSIERSAPTALVTDGDARMQFAHGMPVGMRALSHVLNGGDNIGLRDTHPSAGRSLAQRYGSPLH